jgi:hypothetical protein
LAPGAFESTEHFKIGLSFLGKDVTLKNQIIEEMFGAIKRASLLQEILNYGAKMGNV